MTSRVLVAGAVAGALVFPPVAAEAVSAAADQQPVGTTRLIDVRPDGGPTKKGSSPGFVSGDGRYVGFSSAARLVAGTGKARDFFHAYLADRTTGAITLIDATAGGRMANGYATAPSMSADGSLVVFGSSARNLDTDDTGRRTTEDVFLLDTVTGALRIISTAADGGHADSSTYDAEISADGSTVVFSSSATNLIAGAESQEYSSNVFRYDVATRVTTLVSATAAGGYTEGGDSAVSPTVSADGNLVTYWTRIDDIVPGTSGFGDVILYDARTETSTLVSGAVSGRPANGQSLDQAISADGSTIAFSSGANNLVVEPVPGHENRIYLYDVDTAVTRLASRAYDGGYPRNASLSPDLNEDGSLLTFGSWSDDIVAGDDNRRDDVFLQDVGTGATELISHDDAGNPADGHSFSPSMSDDGTVVAYGSVASNLVAETHNSAYRVFAYRAS